MALIGVLLKNKAVRAAAVQVLSDKRTHAVAGKAAKHVMSSSREELQGDFDRVKEGARELAAQAPAIAKQVVTVIQAQAREGQGSRR